MGKLLQAFRQITLLVFILLISAISLNSETISDYDSTDISKNIKEIIQNIENIKSNLRNETDEIKYDILKNLELSIAEQYMYGVAWNQFLMGRYYQLRFKNDSAQFYYEKAWPIATKQNINNLVHAISLGLGNIYWESGNYSLGVVFSLEAKSYFEDKDAMSDKYGLMNLIALNYEGLFEYDHAEYYFNKAVSIADSMGNQAFVGIIYSNLGRLYFKQKEYPKALDFLHKGVEIEELKGYIANAGKSYTTMANAFLAIEKTDSCLKYLNKALQYNLETQDNVGLARTYLSFGKYHTYLNHDKTSIQYLLKTAELAKKIQLNNELINAYELLAVNYRKLGDYKKSNIYYTQYFELFQKMYDVEKINKINSLEHQLRLQTKENEISLLKLNEEHQTKNLFLITTIAIIFISLLLIFFLIYYRRNNKLLKYRNLEIQDQKNILEQLNQKLILAKQNADQADQLKSKFLNNITHEIRTPLNGIVGFSSLIAESNLGDKKKKETWNIIKHSSETLINTVEGLLKLSMLESGQITANNKPVNIRDFTDKFCSEFPLKNGHLINDKVRFKYNAEITSKVPPIHTDPNILESIFYHILENAFKFTPKGSVKVDLREKENQIQVIISDSGIGIEEESRNSIFKQFSKGMNVPSNSAGLGIGLTISEKLTKLIDAEISYESELNKGSIFCISLPNH